MSRVVISLIGLGKLGTGMAACLASRGFEVVGVEIDPAVVDRFNHGQTALKEPGLGALLFAHRTRVRATLDVEEAIRATQVTFVIVPTPSDADGGFSLQYVLQAMQHIGRALAEKSSYHLVALTSTVLPGSMVQAVQPALEGSSGKGCGLSFGLCYSPLFISLGSVIRDLLHPDLVLIGESDERAGRLLASVYDTLCENRPAVARMNFVNAELTKLALNTYVTTKISFANMLVELCERLPGADIDVVTRSLGHDSRVGGRYLTGALSYGGPCFPRDNVAMSYLARQLGCRAWLSESTAHTNRWHAAQIVARIQHQLEPDMAVGVLGLAYKPDTDIVEESAGLTLAQGLVAAGFQVVVYDPLAMDNARRVLGAQVTYAPGVEACLAAVDAVVIANPAKEFQGLEARQCPVRAKPFVVFDCWRLLRATFERAPHVRYVAVGVHHDEERVAAGAATCQVDGSLTKGGGAMPPSTLTTLEELEQTAVADRGTSSPWRQGNRTSSRLGS